MIDLAPFRRHMQILLGRKTETIDIYCRIINEFYAWRVGNGVAAEQSISRHEIEQYLEWCFYRGNTNTTRVTKLIAISKYIGAMVYQGIFKEDVTLGFPRPKKIRKPMEKFTRDQVIKIFRQIDIMHRDGLTNICIMILGVFAGLRVSEISNLRIKDIIEDNKQVDLNIVDAKHGGSRTVWLWKAPSAFILQMLWQRISAGAGHNDHFLVLHNGNLFSTQVLDDRLKKLVKQADVRKTKVHMHMLRATHASDLRHIDGYDVYAIADRLGHKEISTTARYVPSRERLHRTYRSLHAYWIEFPRIFTKNKGENEKL